MALVKSMDLRKKTLDFNERKEIQKKIDALEGILKNRETLVKQGVSVFNTNDLDVEAVHRQLAKHKKTLRDNSPPVLKAKERDELDKERKELESELKANMLTKAELYTTDPLKIRDSAKKLKDFTINYQPKIFRYREIMRRLEPNNPEALNIERFRV